MKKRSTPLKKRLENGVLSAFALALTALPILSIGYFVHGAFFSDPRKVVDLQHIDSASAPRLFDEPIISVTFDDGWESVYTKAAPLLQKYNIRTTQYILPGEFKSHSYLSLQQAHSLKSAGHEIMSHTMSHRNLTTLDSTQAQYELEESKKQLISNDLASSSEIHFAAPESALNEAVDQIITRFYLSSRNTFGDIQNGIDANDVNVKGEMFSRYNIIGYSVRPETTTRQINEALQFAKANNGWLVLVYHQIDDTKETYSVSEHALDDHLRIIKESRIKTAPLGEVLASSEER